jgi:hypothetical protein
MFRHSFSIAALVASLLVGCTGVRAACPAPDAAKGVYASAVYSDGVVAFEPSHDPDNPIQVVLYRKSKSCAGSKVDSYSVEGAPPVVEAVFAYSLNHKPHLFVIVSWAINSRGEGTYGKLYQVYAYGGSDNGSLVPDAGIAARNDMTGIEGMSSGESSHFLGKTPAEVKKLIDEQGP